MTPDLDPSTIKLLAFDIDGTLIGASKRISSFTKTILSRLRAKGILTTLATGRILPAVKDYAGELEIDIPLILSNGSILQDRKGNLTAETSLPADVVQAAIRVSREESRDLVLYIRDQIFIEKLTDNIDPTYGSILNKGLYEIGRWESLGEKLDHVTKCVIVDNFNEQNLFDTEPILREALDGRAVTLRTSTVLLEVQPKDVTKAIGLRKLAEVLSIDVKQVIAFGDYNNDVEMLREAGLGVAVGDATPACLEAADLLVASPEEEGPAHFLEEFLLT
jgi:Cof subfamily protein (haloacid dehalogenase superfamily)